jgi:hypothetical protein
MHDFDANEDLARLPGSGQDSAPEPADGQDIEPGPPAVRRFRRLHAAAARGARGWLGPRCGTWQPARRRGAPGGGRCPSGARAELVQMPSRVTRRLWSTCHGRAPGSLS